MRVGVGLLGLSLGFVGCSASSDGTSAPPAVSSGTGGTPGSNGGASATGGVTNGGATSGGTSNGGAAGASAGGATAAGGSAGSGGAACSGAKPVDIMLLLDQSASMAYPVGTSTKWTLVSAALSAYLGDSASADVGIGLGYFPVGAAPADKPCASSTDCSAGQLCATNVCVGGSLGSCTESDYTSAQIPIAPDHGAAIASLTNQAPGGERHLFTALGAAQPAVEAWGGAHPGRRPVVVIVADGTPNGCTDSSSQPPLGAVEFTVASLATVGIRTYVIGFGFQTSNLDAIAATGNTTQSMVVDLASADPGAALVQALKTIQHDASCGGMGRP